MFVDLETASRIERAEAHLTRAVAEAVATSGSAPRAFVRQLGVGVAAYLRAGSPLNKLIGVGMAAPPDAAQLASIEAALSERDEPVRVELCTLAPLESCAELAARGYVLLGFENVLIRSLSGPRIEPEPSIRLERVTAATQAVWRETSVNAAACSDDSGVPVDQLSLQMLDEAFADMLEVNAFDRYLAFWGDAPAGAASMLLRDGIALLSGSATLPAYRRRGVQRALIAARLEAARERGAELAVVTTAPGSQSQANVMKHGFALAYARAILVLKPPAPAP